MPPASETPRSKWLGLMLARPGWVLHADAACMLGPIREQHERPRPRWRPTAGAWRAAYSDDPLC
jgi:hypothetical protein